MTQGEPGKPYEKNRSYAAAQKKVEENGDEFIFVDAKMSPEEYLKLAAERLGTPLDELRNERPEPLSLGHTAKEERKA